MDKNKVNKIKKAAVNVFTKKGYKETKISDIAAESEISVGTIYSYFKSKKELFESLNLPELEKVRPQYEARRMQIIKKALEVFGRNGYNAASMDSIAAECGFTKAVLYQFFKSKEDLFASIFYEPSIFQNLDDIEIEPSKADLHETLIKMGTLFMKMFEDPNRLNLTRIIIAESVRFPELGHIMHTKAIDVVAEKFSHYLNNLSETGKIQCADTKLAARSYFGMLYSFIITDRILIPSANGFSSDDIVRFASNVFQRGLSSARHLTK